MPFFLSKKSASALEPVVGNPALFFIFGFFCIVYGVLAFFWVPETHGKTYKDVVYQDTQIKKEMELDTPQVVETSCLVSGHLDNFEAEENAEATVLNPV